MKPTVHKKIYSEENLEQLLSLSKEGKFVPSLSIRRRMGENRMNNPSMYHVWKWDRMLKVQRELIKSIVDKKITDKAIIGYFLKFEKDGLLDRISTWKDHKLEVKMYSIALGDNQRIWVDSEKIVVNCGDVVEFPLQLTHCVPKVDKEALWLCFVVVG